MTDVLFRRNHMVLAVVHNIASTELLLEADTFARDTHIVELGQAIVDTCSC